MLFNRTNEFTIALSALGSAGIKACFVSLVEPAEKVIVCQLVPSIMTTLKAHANPIK
jgi:aspartate aminotransferase-like enzyme